MSITFNERSDRVLPSTAAAPRSAAVALGLAGLAVAKGLFRSLARQIEARRAERQLLSLGEAGLKDIGVGHGGAEWAARNGRDADAKRA